MRYIFSFLLLISPFLTFSQEGFPLNGVEDVRDNHYAFTNANIIVDYNTTIENGILIIKTVS